MPVSFDRGSAMNRIQTRLKHVESYKEVDPESALFKCRLIAETILRAIFKEHHEITEELGVMSLGQLIGETKNLISPVLKSQFEAIQKMSNVSAHDQGDIEITSADVEVTLATTLHVIDWFKPREEEPEFNKNRDELYSHLKQYISTQYIHLSDEGGRFNISPTMKLHHMKSKRKIKPQLRFQYGEKSGPEAGPEAFHEWASGRKKLGLPDTLEDYYNEMDIMDQCLELINRVDNFRNSVSGVMRPRFFETDRGGIRKSALRNICEQENLDWNEEMQRRNEMVQSGHGQWDAWKDVDEIIEAQGGRLFLDEKFHGVWEPDDWFPIRWYFGFDSWDDGKTIHPPYKKEMEK